MSIKIEKSDRKRIADALVSLYKVVINLHYHYYDIVRKDKDLYIGKIYFDSINIIHISPDFDRDGYIIAQLLEEASEQEFSIILD